MNLVVDDELLEQARKKLGHKTYSETVNRALREVLRIEVLRDGLDRFEHDMWWPGYVEEFGPNPPLAKSERQRLVRSAKTARASRKCPA
jgi:putative antitoxin of VapBC-like toxin-antitoxin system